MEEHGLSLAVEKTEIVLLTRRQIPTIVVVRVGDETIATKEAVKYLGLRLDTKLSFWNQIRHSSEKAAKVTTSLSRLMANIGGPTPNRRRLLMSVINSIHLYGCEVWADSLKKKKYRKQMASVQRRGALRIASSYRTVSEPAVLVIAGVIPIDLLASERKQIHDLREEHQPELAREAARKESLRHWGERWRSETRGRWTARLIRDLAPWIDRSHGVVNYYLTQFLTGHGYFNSYLHRMGKVEDPACIYGDAELDTAHHTFFECERWGAERRQLEAEIGEVTPDNIVGLMLTEKDRWLGVRTFVENVLRKKKKDLDQQPHPLAR